jgi:hypothetical protein
MILYATLIWLAGLLTVVPYATYHLLFRAQRDEYAFLITFVLFWVFGFWGVVGPLITAIKVRRVFRAIEQSKSRAEVEGILRSPETRELAIDFIATEHKIPRFVARRVYQMFETRIGSGHTPTGSPK